MRMLAGVLAAITMAATPSLAQEIKPLDVYQDPHGIDLTSNNVSTSRMPALSIPAAPELTFRNLEDFTPLLVITPASDPGFEPVLYQVNAGGLASDAFANCTMAVCTSEKGTGSRLFTSGDPTTPGNTMYKQGATGRSIYFDVQTEYYDGTNPPPPKWLASSVQDPGGRTLSFTYDQAHILYALRHRPASVSSTSGYTLRFTYATGDAYSWGILAKAEIVKTSEPSVVLASLSYSGNTVTDIAMRVFQCVCQPSIWGTDPQQKGSRLTLPGESVNAFDTFRQSGSNTRTVTSDGVAYTYVSTPDNSWSDTPDAIHDLTITGPEGFSRYIDVTNTQSTTGEFAPPRRRIDSIRDSQNQTTYYHYDAAQKLRKVVYPEENAVEVFYNENGNLVEKRAIPKPGSGLANIVELASYNNCNGFLCWYFPDWTQDAKGNRTDYTWDATLGIMLTSLAPADANGQRRKTKYTYTASGPSRVIREEVCAAGVSGNELTCGSANAFVKQTTYLGDTSLPLTETITDGVGNGPLTTAYAYDAAGRLLSQDGPLAGSDDAAYHRYDVLGRKVREVGPLGKNGHRPASLTHYRQSDDQPWKVETGRVPGNNPDGAFTAHSEAETLFNTNRLPKRTTVRAGNGGGTYAVTQVSYDTRNRERCTAVRMNPGQFASLPDDACLLSPAGADGPDRITRKTHDSEDRVEKLERAVGTPLQQDYARYTYTIDGLQQTMTDARGYTARMEYDGHRRQSRWYLPSETTPGQHDPLDYEEYRYDPNGNRDWLRKRDGTELAFQYDNLNRVTRKTVPERSGLAATHTRDVFYEYDIRGLQTSARFDIMGGGQGITTYYDRYGRVSSDDKTMDGQLYYLSRDYNAGGNRTALSHGDIAVFYDHTSGGQFDRIRDQYGNILAQFSYNDRGELASAARASAAPDQTWTYDPIGRMATSGWANAGSFSVAWGYARNAASQIVSETQSNDLYSWDGFVPKNLVYVANGQNEYTAVDSTGYCHDANGNLTADGDYAYLYDAENRMVEMRAQSGTACPTWSSGYTGQLKASLRYDPLGRLHEVINYVNGVSQGPVRFHHDGDALVGEFDAAGNRLARYLHGPSAGVDDPLVEYAGADAGIANVRFLYADPRGSIVYRADASNASNMANTYDEYGQPSANNVGRFQYTGQVWLPELGMYYYKARIYSPRLGRFMQTDPIGYADGTNIYAYVGNDPVNGVDPTGEQRGNWRKALAELLIEILVQITSPSRVPEPTRNQPEIEQTTPQPVPNAPRDKETTPPVRERPKTEDRPPPKTPIPRPENLPIPRPENLPIPRPVVPEIPRPVVPEVPRFPPPDPVEPPKKSETDEGT